MELPFMDIQPNWHEVLSSTMSNSRKAWVSCRCPGEKSENSCLVKSADGSIQAENANFVVKGKNPFSVTVNHPKSKLTTHFVRPRKLLPLHDKQLHCVSVSESGELGVCSSEDGKLWVWETDTGDTRRNLEGHVGDVYTCRFFPSGIVVLSGGADLRLNIWSVEDGSCARSLAGHTRGINDTTIVDRGRNIISVSSDGTAKLWDCGSAKCLDTLMTTGSAINACTLATDTSLLEKNGLPPEEPECGTNDKLLLVACEDGSLACCDVRNRQSVMRFSLESKTAFSACTFLNACQVLGGAEDGNIVALDLRDASTPLGQFKFCESPVRALHVLSESRCTAGHRDGSCTVWDSRNLTQLNNFLDVAKLTGPEADPMTSVVKSQDCVYTSCRDGSVRAYSMSDVELMAL